MTRTKARIAASQGAGQSLPSTPQKKRQRQKKRSIDVDDYIKNVVKRTIYDMHLKCKKH